MSTTRPTTVHESELRAAQSRWFRHLAAAVDDALECGEGELLDDVARAYALTAQRLPEVRDLLDRYADHPALVGCVAREHALLARAAGAASWRVVTERAAAQRFEPDTRSRAQRAWAGVLGFLGVPATT